MRQLTKSKDRVLFGVAGGIAEYLDIDRTLCRVLWVVGGIIVPPSILAYLILGLVMPEPVSPADTVIDIEPGTDGQQQQTRSSKRLTKSRDSWITGVAGGIAEYFGWDPAIVRLLFLVLVFLGFGGGLLAYIILALVMPDPDPANY